LIGPFGPYAQLNDGYDGHWRSYARRVLGPDEKFRPAHFPDFLQIGGPRTGTTWLNNTLANHRSFNQLESKEIRYFTINWMEEDIHAYARHFAGGNGLIQGEFTPDFMLLPQHSIETIYKILPDLKLLYAIKNPIADTWSLSKQMLRFRAFEFSDFSSEKEDLSAEIFIKQFLLDFTIAFCDHETALKKWLSIFPHENIFIYFYEDVIGNSDQLIERMQDFLGLKPIFPLVKLGSTEIANPGLPGDIPDVLQSFLQTLWRGRVLGLAKYLKQSLGIALPIDWEADFTATVLPDDIKIHNNPNGIDYFMKCGADSGWFYAKSRSDNSGLPEDRVDTYKYLFDLHHAVTNGTQRQIDTKRIGEIRQERIISHMNAELFFKAYPENS
jgi:hypothetical protein